MPAPTEVEFRAMGTDVHLVVVGGRPGAVGGARRRIDDLEERWSRFRPDSEVSRLNRAHGEEVELSRLTYLLVERALLGSRLTGGRFDPTVLDAVVASGYDRSFDLLRSQGPGPVRGWVGPAPGADAIEVHPATRTVRLARGCGFDPGGIGKGLAADLVVNELIAEGADGASVNLGGDVRVAGEPPTDDGWVVAVEHPQVPGVELARVVLFDGAVATSSRCVRTWTQAGRARHHLVDPATGNPAEGRTMAISVSAEEAWWAEVLAKALFLAGPEAAPELLAELDRQAGALLVDESRTVHRFGNLGRWAEAA